MVRLVARMGIENLIHAAAILRDNRINVVLLIAGKGYMQAALEALIAELDLTQRVRLLGFVSEAQLPVYLAASDLFVLPTEALEGFGLATIEALGVGLPVIGTPIGTTPEILGTIDPKLITKASTPQALAKSISYWLAHNTERHSLRQRARSTVETL